MFPNGKLFVRTFAGVQEPEQILFASLHQADGRFPHFSRGVQCTCNALMSVIQGNASTKGSIADGLQSFVEVKLHQFVAIQKRLVGYFSDGFRYR